MQLHDLERLETEHGLDFLLQLLLLRLLAQSERVLRSGVRFALDDREWAVNSEIKSKVRLGVIRECQLLDKAGSVVILDGPVLDVDVLASVHLG